jgi:hypothetical protein
MSSLNGGLCRGQRFWRQHRRAREHPMEWVPQSTLDFVDCDRQTHSARRHGTLTTLVLRCIMDALV